MKQWNSEDEMLKAIREQLDAKEQSLDQNILRELRLRRAAALEQLDPHRQRNWLLPAGVTLALTVTLTVIGLQVMSPASVGPQSPFMDDVNLLSASDELELYEDLEFYQWLEIEEHVSQVS